MKRLIKIVIISIGLFCGVITMRAQEVNTISSTVEFVVSTDTFVENSNFKNFVDNIVPFINSNSDEIEKILLVGSASPEGSVNLNIYLANKRADKIYSYIRDYVPKNKIIINNDYSLFLEKTGLNEDDYHKLRATYIEIHMKSKQQCEVQRDTIYIRDTVKQINNYYYNTESNVNGVHGKPVISVYNDLLSDMMFRLNIGTEIYFHKMSFFVEGSFSNWDLVGKTYNIDIWHTGFRKYFNDNYDGVYIETYMNGGYFDTDLFNDIGKIGVLYGGGIGIGYVFNLCPHWKIAPIVRIGLFEKIYYADYYYTESGNINVSFGNYNNGKLDNSENINQGVSGDKVVTVNKTITKEFFENSNKAYYMGPTYVGIYLKRDFCIYNKPKNIKK